MTFKKYVYMIKRYLKNTNKSWEMCDKFYGKLYYTFPRIPYKRSTYKKWDFLDEVEFIEEQSEPWNVVEEYKSLDEQLEELMKKFRYM